MASQARACSAPEYAFVRDYECDSNPAYGVVESGKQPSSGSGARADPGPLSLTTAADTVSNTVSGDCSCYDP